MQFNITWRDGAYYVSEPNIGDRTVVDLTDYESVCAERDRARACLAFFASVIKSGEPWTETCEREYRAARTTPPTSEQE